MYIKTTILPLVWSMLVAVPPVHVPILQGHSLQGTWKAIAGESKTVKLEKQDFEKEPVTMVFVGNKLTMTWGNEKGTYQIKLNAKARPAAMDIIYPKGKGTNHAIYSLEKGKLKICFSKKMNPNSAEERPIRFTTNRDDNNDLNGLGVLILRKEK